MVQRGEKLFRSLALLTMKWMVLSWLGWVMCVLICVVFSSRAFLTRPEIHFPRKSYFNGMLNVELKSVAT